MSRAVLAFGLVVVFPLWLIAAFWVAGKGAQHGRALAEWQLRRRQPPHVPGSSERTEGE